MHEPTDDRTFTARVLKPVHSDEELLLLVLQEFGVVSRAADVTAVPKQELIDTLNAFLLSLRAIGAQARLVIDDALSPPLRVLEQVQLLLPVAGGAAPKAPARRTRPYLARVAAGLLLAAVLGGSAAAVWHYREYATAFVQRYGR